MNGNNTAWRALESCLAEHRLQGIQDIHLEIHLQYNPYWHQGGLTGSKVITRTEGIARDSLPRLVSLRPTTFFVDIVIDEAEHSPNIRLGLGVKFRGIHSGWW
ncbi:hypothetical protein GALMADRAFT_157417 [Galerina marginata CBS 339.88]|uniref:Uncharacterized protein n=1 Tax=Galerina marginata (strain CBS 339.88) TaxID=685588 RepID=A0A067SXW6_GALM3|nr:hypothetical protein GALMADRAFT_157417 [Galerina marginata CBS 339.88]